MMIAHVTNYDIVFADGTLKTLYKDLDPNFYFHIHSFGGTGVITRMSLRLVPRFNVFKAIYKNLSWDAIKDDAAFDQLEHGSDFLSLFNDWNKREFTSVWQGHKYRDEDQTPEKVNLFYEAVHIEEDRVHPVLGRDATPCVSVGAGSWREKIYHFRPDQPPSSDGDEIQSEYYVPYNKYRAVMEALYKVSGAFKHLVQVTESRMVCADNIPLSPANGQNVIGIHFTWFKKHDEVVAVLPVIEHALKPFGAKPHYGKIFHMSGRQLHTLFGNDYVHVYKLIKEHDP